LDLVCRLPRRPGGIGVAYAQGVSMEAVTDSSIARAEKPGPTAIHDSKIVREVQRGAVWIGMVLAVVGCIVLAQPIMLIIGGLVFAVILDGGTRLLARVL